MKDAELKVAEALLAQAQQYKDSADPELRIAAARHEIKLTRQISILTKKRKPGNGGHSAPQQD